MYTLTRTESSFAKQGLQNLMKNGRFTLYHCIQCKTAQIIFYLMKNESEHNCSFTYFFRLKRCIVLLLSHVFFHVHLSKRKLQLGSVLQSCPRLVIHLPAWSSISYSMQVTVGKYMLWCVVSSLVHVRDVSCKLYADAENYVLFCSCECKVLIVRVCVYLVCSVAYCC